MLVVCSAGVGLILAMEMWGSAALHGRSTILALVSGLAYAGVILSLRQLRDADSAWLVALNHLVTGLVMAPMALGSQSTLPQGNAWLVMMAFGFFQMGLAYLLFAKGLRTTPGHVAAMITLLEPILLPVWLFLVWYGHSSYRPPAWWTLLGGGLILTGLVYRFSGQKQSTN
jgi:drug/metabolite transporter (DMT)-like permease